MIVGYYTQSGVTSQGVLHKSKDSKIFNKKGQLLFCVCLKGEKKTKGDRENCKYLIPISNETF